MSSYEYTHIHISIWIYRSSTRKMLYLTKFHFVFYSTHRSILSDSCYTKSFHKWSCARTLFITLCIPLWTQKRSGLYGEIKLPNLRNLILPLNFLRFYVLCTFLFLNAQLNAIIFCYSKIMKIFIRRSCEERLSWEVSLVLRVSDVLFLS